MHNNNSTAELRIDSDNTSIRAKLKISEDVTQGGTCDACGETLTVEVESNELLISHHTVTDCENLTLIQGLYSNNDGINWSTIAAQVTNNLTTLKSLNISANEIMAMKLPPHDIEVPIQPEEILQQRLSQLAYHPKTAPNGILAGTKHGPVVWQGTIWEPLREDLGRSIAQAAMFPLATAIQQRDDEVPGPKPAYSKNLHAASSKSGNDNFIKSVLVDGRFTRYELPEPTGFHMGHAGGVIDFKNGKCLGLSESKRLGIRTRIDATYDPNATTPKVFLEFVHRIMHDNPYRVRALQIILASCLVQHKIQNSFYVFTGVGGDGKSTIVNLLGRLLGTEYGAFVATDSAHISVGANVDKRVQAQARMEDALLASFGDGASERNIDADAIKDLAGKMDDIVMGRFLYGAERPIRVLWKSLLQTNHKLSFTDTSMRRRIEDCLIQFDATAAGPHPYVLNANQLTGSELDDALKAELPGILRWLVEAVPAYLELEKFIPHPRNLAAQTANAIESSDHYTNFLLRTMHSCGTPVTGKPGMFKLESETIRIEARSPDGLSHNNQVLTWLRKLIQANPDIGKIVNKGKPNLEYYLLDKTVLEGGLNQTDISGWACPQTEPQLVETLSEGFGLNPTDCVAEVKRLMACVGGQRLTDATTPRVEDLGKYSSRTILQAWDLKVNETSPQSGSTNGGIKIDAHHAAVSKAILRGDVIPTMRPCTLQP